MEQATPVVETSSSDLVQALIDILVAIFNQMPTPTPEPGFGSAIIAALIAVLISILANLGSFVGIAF